MANKQPEFEVPNLTGKIKVPAVREGAMSHSEPFVARPEHNEALGYPGELVDDWQQKGIARLGELVQNSRALRVYLDSCVKCGACTCLLYTSPSPRDKRQSRMPSSA